MLKKYLPFILVLLAAGLLFYIKTHQRGKNTVHPTENITVPVNANDGFDRNFSDLIFTKHAYCRMACRHIDESEVVEVIKNGTINYDKIEKDSRGRTFPLEGITHDKQHVRVVVAPQANNELVLVTVIDLEKDWPCDCK